MGEFFNAVGMFLLRLAWTAAGLGAVALAVTGYMLRPKGPISGLQLKPLFSVLKFAAGMAFFYMLSSLDVPLLGPINNLFGFLVSLVFVATFVYIEFLLADVMQRQRDVSTRLAQLRAREGAERLRLAQEGKGPPVCPECLSHYDGVEPTCGLCALHAFEYDGRQFAARSVEERKHPKY